MQGQLMRACRVASSSDDELAFKRKTCAPVSCCVISILRVLVLRPSSLYDPQLKWLVIKQELLHWDGTEPCKVSVNYAICKLLANPQRHYTIARCLVIAAAILLQ
jgi:hypothetical protein